MQESFTRSERLAGTNKYKSASTSAAKAVIVPVCMLTYNKDKVSIVASIALADIRRTMREIRLSTSADRVRVVY